MAYKSPRFFSSAATKRQSEKNNSKVCKIDVIYQCALNARFQFHRDKSQCLVEICMIETYFSFVLILSMLYDTG